MEKEGPWRWVGQGFVALLKKRREWEGKGRVEGNFYLVLFRMGLCLVYVCECIQSPEASSFFPFSPIDRVSH